MAHCSSKDQQAVMDMLTALKSPEMRRVLRRILARSNILSESYAPGDALATAYNEGLRALGIWLKHEIDRADAEAFSRLLMEQ